MTFEVHLVVETGEAEPAANELTQAVLEAAQAADEVLRRVGCSVRTWNLAGVKTR